jgi:hypothetical protein
MTPVSKAFTQATPSSPPAAPREWPVEPCTRQSSRAGITYVITYNMYFLCVYIHTHMHMQTRTRTRTHTHTHIHLCIDIIEYLDRANRKFLGVISEHALESYRLEQIIFLRRSAVCINILNLLKSDVPVLQRGQNGSPQAISIRIRRCDVVSITRRTISTYK